jgi:hypothetical protein
MLERVFASWDLNYHNDDQANLEFDPRSGSDGGTEQDVKPVLRMAHGELTKQT